MDQTKDAAAPVADPQNLEPRAVTIAIPDAGALATEQNTIVAQANALTITNDQEYLAACEQVSGWAKFKARVEAFFRDDCDRSYKLWQSLTGKRKAIIDPVEQAVRIAGAKVSAYEAAKRAVAEQEARQRAEAARKMEEEQKLQEAIALDQAGLKDVAKQVLDEPVTTPALSAAPATPKFAGKSSSTKYDAKVVDLKALLVYILAHPEDMNLVEVNTQALRKRAEYQKDSFALAGCELVKTTVQAWSKK